MNIANQTEQNGTSIVTLTMNPTIDVMMHVDQFIAGPKLRTGNPSYDPGGGGINVSRVVHELGGRSLAVFAAGGPTGDKVRTLLEETGIAHRHIPIAEGTRQNITIAENSTNRLYRLVTAGPRLSDDEQAQCRQALEQLDPPADYLVLSGSLPPGVGGDFYSRIIRKLKPRGTRVILDTKGEALRRAVEEGVYLVKPNLHELSELAGRELDDEREQQRAAEELIDRRAAEVIIVSLGPSGVLLATGEGSRRLRAPSVPVRSAVGAGDSMVAAVTFALARGRSVKDAVRWGIAAGSAAVMTTGTRLCRREDVERLYEELAPENRD